MAKPLRGERILVTGPAGQIAFPLASRLARDNQVWGRRMIAARHPELPREDA